MNTNKTKIYTYIQELVDVIREEVQDALAEEGNVCGTCLSANFFEENSTKIMAELYAVSKENPEEAMDALLQFSIFNDAVTELAKNLCVTAFQLNREELVGEEN